jgi:hypothetical protein
MDESPDHEPILIEQGMGVHLNHPITAQRGIRNSRPARWELRKPHPPSRGETTRGRAKQVEELVPIASNGPRPEGSTHGYTSWKCTERGRMPNTCAWHRRGRLEYCRCRLKLTPRTPANSVKKTLQEHPRSCKASGARPAGPLGRPHGIAPAIRREESPISKRQHLRDHNGYTHRCSGATVGDSHKGPLNNQGNPLTFAKKQNANEPKTCVR